MPHHPPLPKAPLPSWEIFDPFNSSSSGHQVCPSRLAGTTSWRDSRSYKLAHQFRDSSGRGGPKHLSDKVGAGSENWRKDGRKDNGDWEPGAIGVRENGWQDIRGLMSGSRKRPSEEVHETSASTKKRCATGRNNDCKTSAQPIIPPENAASQDEKAKSKIVLSPTSKQPPQIFRGLTLYLNGSTAPEVSDHRLKQLFMQHGGNSSIALGRRTVTHVVLGKACGGGLASSKIHKEVTTIGGKGIKYVSAHWVLDSVANGVRQPEGPYMPTEIAKRIGGSRQNSVKSIFNAKVVTDKVK